MVLLSLPLSLGVVGVRAAVGASEEEQMSLTLTSSAFKEGGPIPAVYTCEGQDLSPPLAWTDPPAGTKSFAFISDDPDAPGKTWVHWVLYNLPPSVRQLPESFPSDEELPDGTRQGMTDFGRIGYGGPCPPSGTHRYFFKLYALDATVPLAPGVTKKQLEEAMKGHVLAHAQLMGTYRRTGR
jgi:Raf kinase inhibitor-like YbhB/YbcL family protein